MLDAKLSIILKLLSERERAVSKLPLSFCVAEDMIKHVILKIKKPFVFGSLLKCLLILQYLFNN
jgi:hypothetical protein